MKFRLLQKKNGVDLRATFSPGEESAFERVICILKSVEGAESEDPESILDRMREQGFRLCMGNETRGKTPPRMPKPSRNKHDVFGFWNLWYSILRKKYPNAIKPNEMLPAEAGNVKTLLRAYGEDTVRKIFEIAVDDWGAIRQKFSKMQLVDIPSLRAVVLLRDALTAGIAKKGITTSTHRVSEFGKKVGAYDDWEM